MNRAEDRIQIGIIKYLRAVLPAREYRVCHIPNGGKRSKIEAAIFKRMGVLAGIADIIIVGPMGRCWFIECKSANGVLSETQRDFQTFCIAIGVPYVIAQSIDHVMAALAHWGIKTRVAEARVA
jgi:hypothetical protein